MPGAEIYEVPLNLGRIAVAGESAGYSTATPVKESLCHS